MTDLWRGFACGECHVEAQAQSVTEMDRCWWVRPQRARAWRERGIRNQRLQPRAGIFPEV